MSGRRGVAAPGWRGRTRSRTRGRPGLRGGVPPQQSSTNFTISLVRRSGVMRSSRIEEARTMRASGSSSASMSGVREGVDRVARVADDQRRRGQRRRSDRGGATRPKNSPWSTEAEGLGSWLSQSSIIWPSSGPRGAPARRARPQRARDGRAEGQRQQQRGEADRAAQQRVVQHRHLDEHALHPVGVGHRGLQRGVGAQRGAAQHRLVDPRVVHAAPASGRRTRPSSSSTSPRGGRSRRGRAGPGTARGSRGRTGCGPAAGASCARTAAPA